MPTTPMQRAGIRSSWTRLLVEGDREEAVHVPPDKELHWDDLASSATSETVNCAAWRDANGESLR